MAIRIKGHKNLLDFVPVKNPAIGAEEAEDGHTVLVVPRSGLLERAVRRFRHTPKALHVDLDGYGSQVWRSIDGEKNIHAIGAELREAFGEGVEPLYERLGQFMNLLKNNKFIDWKH